MAFKSNLIPLLSMFLTWSLFWSPASLAQKLDHLPPAIAQLMRYEQNVNRTVDPARIASLQNQQSQQFAPEAQQWFTVKSYWVPAKNVDLLTAKTTLLPQFERTIGDQKQVLFLVHPESETYFANFLRDSQTGPDFKALATSSSRTLLVHPADNSKILFFAKLSLNKEVGSVVRTIPLGEVARSIGTTIALQAMQGELPSNFKYFPETIGIMPKGMERGGLIIREIPLELLRKKLDLMPMFSFFTPPAPNKKSPVADMLHKLGSESLNENIIHPFAKVWTSLIVQNGIAIEAHAQNFLISTTQKIPDGDFYFRDFGGFNIDLQMFQQKYPEVKLPTLTNLSTDYHQPFHRKAISQSLMNYYEGGVLYGLAAESQTVDRELTYHKLQSALRKALRAELQSFNIEWKGSDPLYQNLAEKIDQQRHNEPIKKGSFCRRALNFMGF